MKQVGRPRVITASLRALIKRLAKENAGWGVRRIVGELKKLGLKSSRSSVRRVLVDEGILPDPDRHAPKGVTTPWQTFIAAHANVMVATDFFCKTVWTPMGKRVAYALVFIHLASRRVMISPSTYHPDGLWVPQQARNVTMWLDDEGIDCKELIRDNDTKFTDAFDELGYVPFSKTGAELLFEVISRCYERVSLIMTTNLPFEQWTEVCGSERLTGAILDRLTHHVHILEANGESYRLKDSKRRSKKNQ